MRIEENNFLRFYMVKKKLKKSEENKFLRIYLMYYGKWKKNDFSDFSDFSNFWK